MTICNFFSYAITLTTLIQVFGDPVDDRESFSLAMKLWQVRIQNALQKRAHLSSLLGLDLPP